MAAAPARRAPSRPPKSNSALFGRPTDPKTLMLLQSFNHTEIFEMDYYFCPTARAGGEEREEREEARGADDDDGDDDLCEKKAARVSI